MKALKRLSCVLLAVLLLMSLSVNAFADGETAKVKVDTKLAGHSFTAYQIFRGTQNDESGNGLASVEWGSDIDAEKFVTALKNIDSVAFAGCKASDPNTVVKALSGLPDNEEMAKKVAEAAYASLNGVAGTPVASDGTTELPNGYYLIKDTTESITGEDAYNDVVLQVTTDVTIQYKTDVPTSEKKVKDVNDSEAPVDKINPTDWQDSADWDIGDQVPFQLKGTLPDNYDDYTTYTLTFHDEQSAGLTFNARSVKVYVDGELVETGSYEVKTDGFDDDCTFEIVFTNVKNIASAHAKSVITVEYTSRLNDGAKIGYEGNPNEMYMEFSNDSHSRSTGKTLEDKVIVFTYEFEANKVEPDGEDEDGNPKTKPLDGAGFTLLKKVPDKTKTVTLNEGTPYEKTYGGDDWGVEQVKEYTLEAGKTTFDFKGLDDGKYILVESTVPDGYNKAEDIEFTISATHQTESDDLQLLTFTAKGEDGSDIDVTQNGTNVEGKFDFDVVNQKGLTLPETGGIGTTIFYVAGGILVAAALVLLITKKRMTKES